MELDFCLDDGSAIPLYKQLTQSIKESIESGRLKQGELVPSTREMAKMLEVSRFTVIKSYEELISQGYFRTGLGTGTFVSKQSGKPHANTSDRDPLSSLSRYGKILLRTEAVEPADAELSAEMNYGAPAPDQLPISQWKLLLTKHCRQRELNQYDYQPDPCGYKPLREAISGLLKRSRSIQCDAEQVFIFSSAQLALDTIARLFLNQGDIAAVEDPGFPGARRTFMSYGAELLPVPVDVDGLSVTALKEAPTAKMVYVTPSHHDPTGVILSSDRRIELLEWAGRNGTLIVEDDFDSEYRYGGAPASALQSIDQYQSVIFLSSFWKTLFPIVRIGFLVVPESFVPLFKTAKSMIERDFRIIEQYALCDLIATGALEKHIMKTRKVYSLRRQALVYALTSKFGKRVVISRETAGMHLLVRFSPEADLASEQILSSAELAGLSLISTRAFYLDKKAPNEFLIAFAHLTEQEIADSVQLFASRLLQNQCV